MLVSNKFFYWFFSLDFLYLAVSFQINQQEKIFNTGIIYLPIPEPQLQLVKPQQSFNSKQQIEQDFSIRYQYLTNDELNHNHENRYRIYYENLYKNVLESILKNFDLNEEILQIKNSIKYQNEILPILIHNHQLAKREKNILYHIITKTWQIFDQCIQNEINIQYQLEQIKIEHQHLINIKIKQEKYQTLYIKLNEINHDVIHLKKGFDFKILNFV